MDLSKRYINQTYLGKFFVKVNKERNVCRNIVKHYQFYPLLIKWNIFVITIRIPQCACQNISISFLTIISDKGVCINQPLAAF